MARNHIKAGDDDAGGRVVENENAAPDAADTGTEMETDGTMTEPTNNANGGTNDGTGLNLGANNATLGVMVETLSGEKENTLVVFAGSPFGIAAFVATGVCFVAAAVGAYAYYKGSELPISLSKDGGPRGRGHNNKVAPAPGPLVRVNSALLESAFAGTLPPGPQPPRATKTRDLQPKLQFKGNHKVAPAPNVGPAKFAPGTANHNANDALAGISQESVRPRKSFKMSSNDVAPAGVSKEFARPRKSFKISNNVRVNTSISQM